MAATLRRPSAKNVDRESRILSDKYAAYKAIGKHFDGGHETIGHTTGGANELVRVDVHTNTVESFFAILKRGVYGTFHNISPKHLHRYVSEFEFRHNTRGVDDGERTRRAILGAEGKGLRYGPS